MSKSSKNVFSNLKFDPKTHSYSLNGKQLTPVTAFVATLKQEQDWDGIAQKYADKNGLSLDEVKKEWDSKGDIALKKGTLVHEYIETRLKGLSFSGQDEWYAEYSAFEKFWGEEKKYLSPIQIEMRIGDEEFGLGGTIDCLMFDSRTEHYHIYDWKTGSKFTIDNPYQSLLPPFNNLPDCHYVNYSMQLSAYHLILKKNTDLKLGQPIIIRLNEDGDFAKYPCLRLDDLLENYLLTGF